MTATRLALALALAAPWIAAAEEPWHHLSEREIRAALADREVTDGKRRLGTLRRDA
jgi:hypothetical protein